MEEKGAGAVKKRNILGEALIPLSIFLKRRGEGYENFRISGERGALNFFFILYIFQILLHFSCLGMCWNVFDFLFFWGGDCEKIWNFTEGGYEKKLELKKKFV